MPLGWWTLIQDPPSNDKLFFFLALYAIFVFLQRNCETAMPLLLVGVWHADFRK